jgi:hypothetical protein
MKNKDPLLEKLLVREKNEFLCIFVVFSPEVKLDFIDHVVGNMPDHEMENTTKW